MKAPWRQASTALKLLYLFIFIALASITISSIVVSNQNDLKKAQVGLAKQVVHTDQARRRADAAIKSSIRANTKSLKTQQQQTILVKCLTKPTTKAVASCLGSKPGAPGQPGTPGVAGTPGRPGQSVQGLKGDTGPRGPEGPLGPPSTVPGPQGADSTVPGPTGSDGKNGADGTPGKDGANGADSQVPGPQGAAGADSQVPGPQGPQGVQGAAGADGQPGAPGRDAVSFTFTFTDGTGVTHTCTIDPTVGPGVVQACVDAN